MFDEAAAWDITSSTGNIVQDALKKEKTKADLIAALNDLKVLVDKVQNVRGDIEKLTSGNATLQMYIDNLTMQMAKRR